MLYSIRKITAIGMVAAAVSLAASLPAHAHVKFEEKNDPQPDETNILFKDTTAGTTVKGYTNQGGIEVDFSSTEALQPSAKGQADVKASDGDIENIAITVPGGTYTDLILDPMVSEAQNRANGEGTQATVDVLTNDGHFFHTYDIGNGDNYLTIIATDNETISSTTVTMAEGTAFTELKQPRISGANGPSVVPEPCSLALLGMGGLPLFGRLRRRFRG